MGVLVPFIVLIMLLGLVQFARLALLAARALPALLAVSACGVAAWPVSTCACVVSLALFWWARPRASSDAEDSFPLFEDDDSAPLQQLVEDDDSAPRQQRKGRAPPLSAEELRRRDRLYGRAKTARFFAAQHMRRLAGETASVGSGLQGYVQRALRAGGRRRRRVVRPPSRGRACS
jgi:hypothetical protein